MAGTLALAFLAGVLSILSPCVLPLLPLVLGGALGRHRLGPVALAGGLSLSFVAVGLFVATVGFAIGLDGGVFRIGAALVMLAVGVLLLVPAWQARLAILAGPVGNWVDRRFGGGEAAGLSGQFGVGLLLGMVWSPCVGPTLGAASVLAAQGRDLVQVAATMGVFGLGTALPLLALGLLSRTTLMRWRGTLLQAGRGAKLAFGLVLVGIAGAILLGVDRSLETMLVEASPQWLTALTTSL